MSSTGGWYLKMTPGFLPVRGVGLDWGTGTATDDLMLWPGCPVLPWHSPAIAANPLLGLFNGCVGSVAGPWGRDTHLSEPAAYLLV